MTLSIYTTCTFDEFYSCKSIIADSMLRFGGGFVQGLSIALRAADRTNAQRIYDAFSDLLAPYGPGGHFFPS